MSVPSRLKTTYKAHPASIAPLPSGWTEHRAPTGHLYYYNAVTKTSTYTRPVERSSETLVPTPTLFAPTNEQHSNQAIPLANSGTLDPIVGNSAWLDSRTPSQRRPPPEDRPKHKQHVPGAEPWLLIRTKLRRRFVHNPDTGESRWKFPEYVMKAVVELDRAERERRERHNQGVNSDTESSPENELAPATVAIDHSVSDDCELVEVTDDDDGDDHALKRPRIEEEETPNGPMEFGEDDIAFQLAQMEAPEEENPDGDYEENEPELSEEDSRALFMDLLDDYEISPFKPWNTIVSEGRIIDDERYLVLPNMRSRREVFDDWVKLRAAEVREQREKQAQQDPRIPYMAFLANKATPKLYWQEFRRKYQREPEMKDRKLTDKDREKWYRDHISRLKLPESERKKDLRKLLESLPLRDMNRTTSVNTLPGSLLRDIRYISLPATTRDPIIEGFIETAAAAPQLTSELSPDEEEKRRKEQANRERREKALADREKVVREQKDKQKRDLAFSKGLLREEEAEVRRAMQVGREGLLSHMEGSTNNNKQTNE